jgi:hypothetical protein
MSQQNFPIRATELAIDAAIDTAASLLANEAIHAVASHIPGGR